MRGLNDKNLAATVDALENLGGEARVSKIYKCVADARKKAGDRVPESIDMIVQGTLETYCSESKKYSADNYDVFRMPHGKYQGIYGFHRPGLAQYKEDTRIPTADEL